MRRVLLFFLSASFISYQAYGQCTAPSRGVGSDAVASGAAATGAGLGEPPLVAEGFKPSEASAGLNCLESMYGQGKFIKADVSAEFAKLRKDLVKYSEKQAQCRAKEDRANTLCIEARNPEIQKYAIYAQAAAALLTGLSDSCSGWSKIMNAGNAALGVYQAQCGMWKGMCSSSCTAAVEAIRSGQANAKALVTSFVAKANAVPPNDPEKARYTAAASTIGTSFESYGQHYFERELDTSGDYKAVAKKLETCNGYAKQLATSVLGATGMVKSMAGADKCEEDSSNTPTALAGDTPVDCTIPANKANNMTCICQDAPRTPGCDSLLDSSTVAKNLDNVRAASTTDYVPNTPSGGKIDLGGDGGGLDLASKAGGGSGSSSPGAPGGGRGAGIDGGGGGGSGPAGSPAVQKSALNTNILGGEGGGGGGGGSWGSGGGDDGLRQYLPGGAKDPAAQGLAGQGSGATGVTGPAGKSNWEKVRDRYRDNKRSLLNN